MSDYDVFFKEQMAQWLKNKNGPPPVYNPVMTQFTIKNRQFSPEEAILIMSRESPGLMMELYEYWVLKQKPRPYFMPKAEFVE